MDQIHTALEYTVQHSTICGQGVGGGSGTFDGDCSEVVWSSLVRLLARAQRTCDMFEERTLDAFRRASHQRTVVSGHSGGHLLTEWEERTRAMVAAYTGISSSKGVDGGSGEEATSLLEN